MKETKETAMRPSYPAAAFMRLKSKEHATRRDMERLLDVLKVKSRDQCDVFVVNTYDSYAVCFIKAEVANRQDFDFGYYGEFATGIRTILNQPWNETLEGSYQIDGFKVILVDPDRTIEPEGDVSHE